jgi:hypothetical protein
MIPSHHEIRRLLIIASLVLPRAVAAQRPVEIARTAPQDRPVTAVDLCRYNQFLKATKPFVIRARATLPAAVSRFRAGLPPHQTFFISTRLTDSTGRHEQVFVAVDSVADSSFTGRIWSNIEVVKGYRLRQRVEVRLADVVDWMISKPDGSEEGNEVGKFLDTYQPPATCVDSTTPPGASGNAWTDSIDAIERAELPLAEGRVSRAGSQLRIRLLEGRTVILEDHTTPGLETAFPRYAGYLKAIRSHLVHVLQYEGDGVYLIINDSTGDSTLVYGKPVVSPDAKRFAVTSAEEIDGSNPSRIEVWRMIGRKPVKEFSLDTENEHWTPSDAMWRDSATIDFIENSLTSPAEPATRTRGRLVRMGSTWSVVKSPRD